MPERKDSVDSFDEFFGTPKDDERKKSPIKPKQNDTTIGAMVKTQPIIERPRTPSTPEERRLSTPKAKPKVNTTKTASTASEFKNTSQTMSNRAESVQSKVYESDFDDDNGFEDDETVTDSPDERKKNSSLPPPKQRVTEVSRRGSDSELKSSYTISRQPKQTNGTTRRKEPVLPYIRPHQPRRTAQPPPVRRHKQSASSEKTEAEQRALSAQHNKLKSLEARLAELRRELEAQRIENATLRTIQRREEKAIKKYEEKEYDIHRIVRDYTHEIDHIKEVLTNERETKAKLEKRIEVREEKLRDQTKRLKEYEKIVQEKHLDERYELRQKLNETDKKLKEVQEKLDHQEKHIEHLEKNHRNEVNQELAKQRDLKKQLEARSQKYNDLLLKLEDKTRQVDTMHIYAQRINKHRPDSPSNLSKSRSLQSLQDTSPRNDKKRREQQAQERKTKQQQQRSSSNDKSLKPEKKKVPSTISTKTSSNDDKPSTSQNGHLPPKGKPPTRRLSTPKSVEEDNDEIEDQTLSAPKKPPPPTNAQIHKRSVPPMPSTTNESSTKSSIFKLTEPPAPSKPRPTRDLDEKWSDMFKTNKEEDSTKEDLLAKLVADEQQERRLAAQSTNAQRSSMNMFESSTRSTATIKPPTTTTTVRPSADPFESLFSNNTTKPTPSRTNDLDDIFSTKPSNQTITTTTAQNKTDTFESLFGPSSTASNLTTTNSNSRQYAPLNDKLQRPKVITNAPRTIPNRTVVDEVEEFVL